MAFLKLLQDLQRHCRCEKGSWVLFPFCAITIDHEPAKPWSVQQRIAHTWAKVWVQSLPTGVTGNPEHICCENHGQSRQRLVPKATQQTEGDVLWCTAPRRVAPLLLTHTVTACQSPTTSLLLIVYFTF